jgi:hypothetical protein
MDMLSLTKGAPILRQLATFGLFLLVSVCSCSTQGPNGVVRKYYFGFMVVTLPRQTANFKGVESKDVTNVGFSLGPQDGISLGYNHDIGVYMPPDGRVFLVVQTDKQFAEAKQLITNLNNVGICEIQSPKSFGNPRRN